MCELHSFSRQASVGRQALVDKLLVDNQALVDKLW